MQKKMSEPIRINGGYEKGALKDVALDKISRRDIEILKKFIIGFICFTIRLKRNM
jgi:hypothetical protein